MIETKSYDVAITVTLRTRIDFADIERERPVTVFDAIDNAFGCIPSEQWAAIEDGFGGEFVVTVATEVTDG